MKAKFTLLAAVALLAACASPSVQFGYSRACCRRPPPAGRKSRAGPPASSPWPRPTRWPPTPATRCCKAGGSAIDAAIAVQMVLTLVEPQSSGIGGGAFLLHYNGKDVEAFDGRETAPAAADEKLFLGADGKPLPFYEAVVGGRSVGVPGTVRMLEMAHRQYGRLPWAELFEPAIVLAEGGFKVSPLLNKSIRSDPRLKQDPGGRGLFLQARRRCPRRRLRPAQPRAGRRAAQDRGARDREALYEGEIAQAIVDKVRKHPTNPGRMTLADLAGYQPKKRAPICHDHRARGKDYAHLRLPAAEFGCDRRGPDPGHPERHQRRRPAPGERPARRKLAAPVHWRRRASHSPTATNTWATPISSQPPAGNWMSLLDPSYLAQRARLIGPQSMKVAQPGVPGAGQDQLCTRA